MVQFRRSETADGIPVAEVLVELAGGDKPVVAHRYGPPGSDDAPLAGVDYALLERGPGSGQWYVMAFFDPRHTPVAEEAEVYRYSRSGDGSVQATEHLKSDGTIVLNGTITIQPNGTIQIADKVTIAADGNIETAGGIEADGEITAKASSAPVGQTTHQHPTGTGPSGPPTPGT